MSTTYSFYLVNLKNEKLSYCGPYKKNDDKFYPAEIKTLTSSFIGNLMDFTSSNTKNIPKELISMYQECYEYDISNKNTLLINLDDLEFYLSDKSFIKEAYIHKNIIREIEINKSMSINDLEDYYDSILSKTEYHELNKKEKKDYILYDWIDKDSNIFLVYDILNQCINWFRENCDCKIDFNDLRLLCIV